jgi:dihydroorotate dehydrogenase
VDLYRAVRPILFSLDAERAHHLALDTAAFAARHPLLCSFAHAVVAPRPNPRLAQEVFGLHFENPIGLAAGLDKDGVAIDLWAALGFGFVEVGTVTPGKGQPGNDPPRLVRIVEDRAIVNRMGFNNRGAPHLALRLAERRTKIPVGANVGKAKSTSAERAPDDYVEAMGDVWARADYLVVNVSSPNTPGLRDLQAVSALEPLLRRVLDENQRLARDLSGKPRPILLKIAPDLADDDVDRVSALAVEMKLDGLIATNTTLRHDLLSRAPSIQGGVSGAPLAERALELVRRIKAKTRDLPIIGVGGIGTPDDAYRRLRAGATLIQVYTSFVYAGPALPAKLEWVWVSGSRGRGSVRSRT